MDLKSSQKNGFICRERRENLSAIFAASVSYREKSKENKRL